MHLICLLLLLLLGFPSAPYVRWIDEKGEIHADALKEVVEESPTEVVVTRADGSRATVPMARVLDLAREREDREEERALLDARRDVTAGMRPDAARKTLDRLAQDGSQPWIREYAAAARALLAEQTAEEGADARLQRFLDDHPRSRFQSDCVLAQARVRGRARGEAFLKALDDIGAAYTRLDELQGPLALRFRTLRDGVDLIAAQRPWDYLGFYDPHRAILRRHTAGDKDLGACLLLDGEEKMALLVIQQRFAAGEEAKGRQPRAALHEVKKLRDRADLDMPEVRSDLEREFGRLMLACGDKEGARGAFERARDLAPDPRRREAAEDALRKLAP